MELIAGRYEPVPASDAGGVWNPARDVLSGRLVTVLRSRAPVEPLTRSRELERLRRFPLARSPHLAAVRAVELCEDRIHIVCEPVSGVLLDPGSPPPGLTGTSVRRLATDLFDALAALHLAGVTHGSVQPDAVLLRAGPPVDPEVTVLPVPLQALPAAALSRSPEDDRHRAATLLLSLLRAVPALGPEEEDLAQDLTRALQRVGATDEREWGPPGSRLFPPTRPVHGLGPHAALAVSPLSLSPFTARPGSADSPPTSAPSDGPAAPARRSRPPRALVLGTLALLALTALVVALVLVNGTDGGRTRGSTVPPRVAAPTSPVSTSAAPSAAPSATPSSSPTEAPDDLPTTVPGLIDALSARPDDAGPSGAALLDALRGVESGDGGIVRQSALRLVSLVLDDPGVAPRYGVAALVAFATGPVPGAPGAASCFAVVPGTPDPAVQQDAQRVLDRLPSWQDQGVPPATVDRLRQLATPLAAAQAAPTLAACPTG